MTFNRRSALAAAASVAVMMMGCMDQETEHPEHLSVAHMALIADGACEAAADEDGKVIVCHVTPANEVKIEVDVEGCVNGHALQHADDYIVTSDFQCNKNNGGGGSCQCSDFNPHCCDGGGGGGGGNGCQSDQCSLKDELGHTCPGNKVCTWVPGDYTSGCFGSYRCL